MVNISINRLAGLSLIVGPILAILCFFLQPGGPLVDTADPANSSEVIAAIANNSALAHITGILAPFALILAVYGFSVLQNGIASDGPGEAVSRLGIQFIVFAIIANIIGFAVMQAIAGPAGETQVAESLYAVGNAILGSGYALFGLGIFLFATAICQVSEAAAKITAGIASVAGLVALIAALIGITNCSALQTVGIISGICYMVITLWAITLGARLIRDEN